MAGKRVHVIMDAELVARIDAALSEGQSRGEWIRRAVERALGEGLAGAKPVRPVSGDVPGVGTPPAPAEQPSEAELAALRESFERTSGNYPKEPEKRQGRPVSRSEMFKRASQR